MVRVKQDGTIWIFTISDEAALAWVKANVPEIDSWKWISRTVVKDGERSEVAGFLVDPATGASLVERLRTEGRLEVAAEDQPGGGQS